MIRTFRIHQSEEVDEEEPWNGILSACMFALRATVHTTTQATPAQLVFGRDAILNVKFDANWTLIRQRKQNLIDENNLRENNTRVPHEYRVGDQILITRAPKGKYGTDPYEGPYPIVQVHSNGTVRYQKGAVSDVINIRQVHPYQN
jgi:hypothetical protein